MNNSRPRQRGRHGFAEQVALPDVALKVAEASSLLDGLDALSRYPQTKRMAEGNRGFNDGGAGAVNAESGNKCAIDLESRERQVCDMLEGRIARSEVVQRDSDAKVRELADRAAGLGVMAQCRRFGDLELKLAGRPDV
jgi:hypothetical protein